MSKTSINEARKAYESGDFAKASELYNGILELKQDAQTLYEHALCLLQLRDKKFALLQLNKAVDLDPKNPFRYSSRAYVKDANGDLEGAIEDYKACIKIDPEDAIAHNNLGMLYEKLGRQEAAKHHIKQADELVGAKEFLENQGLNAPSYNQEGEKVQESKEEEKPNLGEEILKVFKDRKSRSEFFTFVRRGWKI